MSKPRLRQRGSRYSLKAAGVEFTPENGGEAGVGLCKGIPAAATSTTIQSKMRQAKTTD